MDELDRRIIMVFAESGGEYLTTYGVTAKLYSEENFAMVRACRPKIRNRIANIMRELDIFEETKDGCATKYRFRPNVCVVNHCILQIPEHEEEFDVGQALIFPAGDESSVLVLNSWV